MRFPNSICGRAHRRGPSATAKIAAKNLPL